MQSCPPAWEEAVREEGGSQGLPAGACTGAEAPLAGWNGGEHGARGAKTFLSFPRTRGGVRPRQKAHSVLEMELRTPGALLLGGPVAFQSARRHPTEEETDAQREDGGLVSLRLLPPASPGSSWVPRGLRCSPHLPELCLPILSAPRIGAGEDVCSQERVPVPPGAIVVGFRGAWPSTPSQELSACWRSSSSEQRPGRRRGLG